MEANNRQKRSSRGQLPAPLPASGEPPAEVARAFSAFPPSVASKLLKLRTLIYTTAAGNSEIGPLVETLKWGQPAYLPKRRNIGTTIRLGYSDKAPDHIALYVHCQTNLIDTYRTLLGPALDNELGPDSDARIILEGNRAVLIKRRPALPTSALALCIEAALTYHLNKRSR